MKKVVFVIMLLWVLLPVEAQQRKKVGIVLSGGGAKGVAHIGALKVIEEAGIPVDYVIGTSMGSIVGGLYAIGYTPHQMDSMVRKQDWGFLLTDKTKRHQKTFLEKAEAEKYLISLSFDGQKPKEVVRDGFVKGENLSDLFADLTIGYHDSIDFNKLPIPFACVAVDLRKGEEVVFHEGRLSEAMRASMAIPAVFTPVRLDSMVLVDGGLLNNFPVDVARRMGAEIVIGVDVRSDPGQSENVTSLVDVVNRLTDIGEKDKYEKNLKDVDLYLKVDVEGYSAASFTPEALDTLTRRGEETARNAWDNLKNIKKDIGITDEFIPERQGPFMLPTEEHPILIHSIRFEGIKEETAERLLEKIKLKENSYMSASQLQQTIDALYSLQTYSKIHYRFVNCEEGYDLVFTMKENKPGTGIGIGLRFDSEQVVVAQLHGSYRFNTTIPTIAVLTGKIGKQSAVRLDYLIQTGALRYLNISGMFEYNDINFYNHGKRVYNTTFNYYFGEVGHSSVLNRNLRLGVGLRYEYYNYDDFLFSGTENPVMVKPKGYFSYYANLNYDRMDKKSYPTRGTALQADISIYTDNLSSYNDNPPFGAISAHWKYVVSPGRRFSIIPSVYGRVVFGQDSPYPFRNVIGGDTPGRYVKQQLPFIGVSYVEVVDNSVLIASLQFRQRMGKKNYLSLIANYAHTDDDFGQIVNGNRLFGMGICYGYDSLFGPIETSLSISNRTKKLGFYMNVGYRF